MKFEEVMNDGLARQYELTLPGEDVEKMIDQKVDEIAPQAHVPGFRPGKVPAHILKSRQRTEIRDMVTRELVNSELQKHFEDGGDDPVEQPQVSFDYQDGDGQGLKCVISYEVFPEFPTINEVMKEIEVKRPVIIDLDAAIKEDMDLQLDSLGRYEMADADYKAVLGDRVTCQLAFQPGGGDGKTTWDGRREVIVDPDSAETIERECVGVSVGDQFTLPMIVRDSEGNEFSEVPNGATETVVKIDRLERRIHFELTDETVQQLGYANPEEFKDMAKKNLERRFQEQAEMIVKRRLLSELMTVLDFSPPLHRVERAHTALLLLQLPKLGVTLDDLEADAMETDDEEGDVETDHPASGDSGAGDAISEELTSHPDTDPSRPGTFEQGGAIQEADDGGQAVATDPSSEHGVGTNDETGENDQLETPEQLLREVAIYRVAKSFIIEVYRRKNDLSIDFSSEEVQQFIKNNNVSLNQLRRGLASDKGLQRFRDSIRTAMVEDRVMEHMLNCVQIKDESVKKVEFVQELETAARFETL